MMVKSDFEFVAMFALQMRQTHKYRVSSGYKSSKKPVDCFKNICFILIALMFISGCDLSPQAPAIVSGSNSPQTAPPIDASVELGNYSLRYEGAYYDNSKITVHFSVTSNSPSPSTYVYSVTLADEYQNYYPTLNGTGNNKIAGLDVVSLSFGVPTNTHLLRTTSMILNVDVYETNSPRLMTINDNQVVAVISDTTLGSLTKITTGKVAGTFTVQVNGLIFEPTRNAILAQEVTAYNTSVVLERVIITPSATTAYLRAANNMYGSDVFWSLEMATITAGKYPPLGSSTPGTIFVKEDGYGGEPNGAFCRRYHANLYNEDVNWMLYIPSLVVDKGNDTSHSKVGTSYYVTGPWNFQFNVPIAQPK